jgi:hypothetical protein
MEQCVSPKRPSRNVKCGVRILHGRAANLHREALSSNPGQDITISTKSFRVVSVSLLAYPIIHQSGHDHLVPHTFRYITHHHVTT